MAETLDIREVARRTGLTSRALRFYEARGLVKPLRTHSGRRVYGRGELEQVNRIVALKRAGLTLAQIASLTGDRRLDLGKLIDLQLEAVDAKRAELDEARSLLLSVKSRIDRGEPVDAATFCSLIKNEDLMMSKDQWDKVSERYLTEEQRAEFAANPPPTGFDQVEYSRKWADLGERVQEAIPLGADSPEAQMLYDAWQELLAPFKAVATPGMMAGVTNLYERMDEWKGEVSNVPFTPEAFRFIQEIGRKRS
ncbi:MerR family transcriptional regulator [Sphingomonas sp. HDW15A]|uniref:MerR family transcriptional regulator n=1 Tax=Sphingomonas sp. HDW15A TaxID=2714942 RepID=UPI001407AA2E|nr:MerR family transcriptional regulator [Sphingomonas sp. HDW15A]QIK96537.1 MerR family transcriptional regulator [Sphingomonas sp. HDW15A]